MLKITIQGIYEVTHRYHNFLEIKGLTKGLLRNHYGSEIEYVKTDNMSQSDFEVRILQIFTHIGILSYMNSVETLYIEIYDENEVPIKSINSVDCQGLFENLLYVGEETNDLQEFINHCK
jgi:hypothetical protein